MRVPGGKPVAIALASLGFFVTAVSIVLACVPADEEPNKTLAVVKVVGSSLVLVAIGAVVYLSGRRRAMSAAMVGSSARVDRRRVALHGSPKPRGAQRTMRVDYYHTGNAKEEHFSLDRVVLEPLPWPGNPARPIDGTNRGKYLFEVTDAASGTRALLARVQLDLRRMGDDGRSEDDRTGRFPSRCGFPLSTSRCASSLKKRDAQNVVSRRLDAVASIPPTSSSTRGARPPSAGALIKLHEQRRSRRRSWTC